MPWEHRRSAENRPSERWRCWKRHAPGRELASAWAALAQLHMDAEDSLPRTKRRSAHLSSPSEAATDEPRLWANITLHTWPSWAAILAARDELEASRDAGRGAPDYVRLQAWRGSNSPWQR